MKFKLKIIELRQRSLIHIIFWILCTMTLTMIYGVGLPNYHSAFLVILMFMPLHIIYFYVTAYYIIPSFLLARRYIWTASMIFVLAIVIAFLFRAIEIFIADPYIYKVSVAAKGPFTWHKLEGSVFTQFLKPVYIINAFEQSNTIIWLAISLKLFKMWHEKKQVALQAELRFLKGQIHPHFLFNTLNNLYAMTLDQSPRSPTVVLGLSNILRYMLYECNTDYVKLSRDLEILESYVSLEKIRYEDRLDLTLSISGTPQNQLIAPLLMLPIVENAFKHGASEMVQEAWINIDIQFLDQKLKLKVSNSKPEDQRDVGETHFEKIGLGNVRKRLDLLYKNAYHLNTYADEEMFVAIIEVDLSRHHPQESLQKPHYISAMAKKGRWAYSKINSFN